VPTSVTTTTMCQPIINGFTPFKRLYTPFVGMDLYIYRIDVLKQLLSFLVFNATKIRTAHPQNFVTFLECLVHLQDHGNPELVRTL